MEELKTEIKNLKSDVEELQVKLDAIKTNVDRGMGIVIGVLAVIGLFSSEIVNWLKHLIRVA